jgi:hypothetical protein
MGFVDDGDGSGCGVAAGGNVLEMGVFEVGGVLEAVAQETVSGDVGCPDQGDGFGQVLMLDIAD